MSRGYTPITPELVGYIRRVSLREPPVLRRLRLRTEHHPLASQQISPEQGQFLHFLTRLVDARKVLEIGVLMGYSSTWMALAQPRKSRLIACDIGGEFTAIAQRTWRAAGVAKQIDLKIAPALETLDALIAGGERGTFDLVFIDADKAGYCTYYERALRLLRPGGLVVADNALWAGKVANPEDHDADTRAIRVFNRKVHGDSRVAAVMVTIGDGLMLACKQ